MNKLNFAKKLTLLAVIGLIAVGCESQNERKIEHKEKAIEKAEKKEVKKEEVKLNEQPKDTTK